ncbi:[NiFe]-hydrogenase assembly chaperone HybE [Kordiimonas lipolytica]|uniref:[NiFe]-hydrogenase assembly chaperone HybE n=1 Tax=Kordiimonas lipolytica TaxID=1662421 RepID=A0ABV8UBM9_9PROT|nr:[NiFe]-hydrogenase assembly chaperone HybE [Kordiimonas lipolytica]
MTNPDAINDLPLWVADCFREIEASRMAGLPFLNHKLEVEPVGFQEWGGGYLGILITPWFLSILYLREEWEDAAPGVGEKRMLSLPSGKFEFIGSHEEALGTYLSCSLFSPVLEFEDQETARAVAQTSMLELLNTETSVSEKEQEMAQIWRGELPASPAKPSPEDSFDQPSDSTEQAEEKVPLSKTEMSRRRFISAGHARNASEASS